MRVGSPQHNHLINSQFICLALALAPDAIAGHLEHYHTLYVVDRHVSEHAMGSIMAWVKTGGVAFIEAGGGGLNEFNETNAARAAVAPFQTLGMWTGGIAGNINRSIM